MPLDPEPTGRKYIAELKGLKHVSSVTFFRAPEHTLHMTLDPRSMSELALAEARYAQIVGYGDAALWTLVTYDYIINLVLEVELLWMKELSPATVVYFLMRYWGIILSLVLALDHLPLFFSEGLCDRLNLIVNVSKVLLLFLVQGLMTHRVYVLYRPSKVICMLLFSLFIIAQATSIASVGSVSASGIYQTLSAGYCSAPIPKDDRPWRLLLDVLGPIVFEFVLVALALVRFVKHAKASRRRLLRWSVDDILHLVVRDNIMYFIAVLSCLFMTSRWALPQDEAEHYTLGAAAYIVVYNASQVFTLAMCGPRIILNMKRFYDIELESHLSSTSVDHGLQLTTIQLENMSADLTGTV